MRTKTSIVALALLAAACGHADEPAPSASASEGIALAEPGDEASEAPPTEAPPPAEAVSVKDANDLYEFSYAYPAAAAAIPQVGAALDKLMEERRAELVAQSRADQGQAKKDGYPYHAHSYGAEWKVVADLPQWLSLSAEIYTFQGGAHGMTFFDSLLWDKRAQAVRKPLDLFAGKAALTSAVRAPFCAALDKEREKRRGAPLDRAGDPMFTKCIDPAAQTVILGSSNGQTFDRIGFLVAPYEAGPYAEGSYEVTLPVTGKLMAALRPQYRAGFSAGQ